MLHSGSRHFGKSVCDYFHAKARELNQRWYSQVPDEYRLAFLPVDTKEGAHYLNWMQLSMDFAKENREKMMLAVKAILENGSENIPISPWNFPAISTATITMPPWRIIMEKMYGSTGKVRSGRGTANWR